MEQQETASRCCCGKAQSSAPDATQLAAETPKTDIFEISQALAENDSADTAGEAPEKPPRRKKRERTEREALLQRLSRIEGQVRGVRGMVEDSAYCTDILTQVSAIQSALNAFNRELLSSHIRSCVVGDIQAGRLEVVDDLVSTIQKLMK